MLATHSKNMFENKNNVEQTGWSRSNPGRPDCYLQIASGASSLLSIVCFALWFYCYVFAHIAFYNGVIASCLTHSNKAVVKSNVSKHIAITR